MHDSDVAAAPGLPDEHSGDGERDGSARAYVIPVWVTVALFGAVAVARSRALGIPIKDPHFDFFLGRIGEEGALVAAWAVIDAWVRGRRSGERVRAVLRRRWTRRRLVLVAGALVAYQLVYLSYHNLKSWLVFRPLRDDLLVRVDRTLFLGHSPWVVLHDLLGQGPAAYVLMVVYESFGTLVLVAVAAALVLPDRIRDSYVYIASGMWVWILGTLSYYLLPSTGPFHARAEDFAGLPHTMIQDTQAKYYQQRLDLIANPHAHDSFAQIAAFASLHIGVSTLMLLMAWYAGMRRTTVVLTAFVACTTVATVYLGWHYAVDDIAGVLLAVAGVAIGRRMVYPRGRSDRASVWRDAG
ncbi:MAG: phosphatase PAP2 family protein [Nocardioidaceae bacterium]